MASTIRSSLAITTYSQNPIVIRDNKLTINVTHLPKSLNQLVAKAHGLFIDKFTNFVSKALAPALFVGVQIEAYVSESTTDEATETIAKLVFDFTKDLNPELHDSIFAADDSGEVSIDMELAKKTFRGKDFTDWLRTSNNEYYAEKLQESPKVHERVNRVVEQDAHIITSMTKNINVRLIKHHALSIDYFRCSVSNQFMDSPVHTLPYDPENGPVDYGSLFKEEYFTYIIPGKGLLIKGEEGSSTITGYEPAHGELVALEYFGYKIIQGFALAITACDQDKMSILAANLHRMVEWCQKKINSDSTDSETLEIKAMQSIEIMMTNLMEYLKKNQDIDQVDLDVLASLYQYHALERRSSAHTTLMKYIKQIEGTVLVLQAESTGTTARRVDNLGTPSKTPIQKLEHVGTDISVITEYTQKMLSLYPELMDVESTQYLKSIPFLQLTIEDTK